VDEEPEPAYFGNLSKAALKLQIINPYKEKNEWTRKKQAGNIKFKFTIILNDIKYPANVVGQMNIQPTSAPTEDMCAQNPMGRWIFTANFRNAFVVETATQNTCNTLP
jgi:hypothetical protein